MTKHYAMDKKFVELTESIQLAVINNDYILLQKLIKPDPKILKRITCDINKYAKSHSKLISLSQLSLMHVAAYFDSFESFIVMQKMGNLSVSIKNNYSLQPIHYACYANSLEVATYIITLFPDVINECQSLKYSLFYYAAASDNRSSDQMIKLLQTHQATLDSSLSKDYNPIYKAIEHNNYTILKSLLNIQSTNQHQIKEQFSSPLMTAISFNLTDVVHLLLENGEDPNYFTPDDNCALSQACLTNYRTAEGIDSNYDIIVALLNAIGERLIEPINPQIQGPIHWICRSKSPQIAKLFFDLHPEINANRVDKHFISGPLLLTNSDLPDSDIIEMLAIFIENGLDLNLFSLENGQKTILEGFCFSIKLRPNIVKFLLENGANPFLPFVGNCQSVRNGTIFEKAIKKPALESIMTDYQENFSNE